MESTTVGQLAFSHKAWAWFEANKKPVLWGGGTLLLVGVIAAFMIYRQDQREIAASEALSSALLPQLSGAGSVAGTPQAYLKVAAEYPTSRAGGRALLLAGTALFTEGKFAEARTQFERFRRERPESPFLGEAILGMAACAEAQGKPQEALTLYKELTERRPNDYVLPQARFALARLYVAQNEPEKARNLYEEVERTAPFTSLGQEAGMRVEELNEKYPRLAAPAPAAGTNAFLPVTPGTGGKK